MSVPESAETLRDYGAGACAFDEGNKNDDVSHNLDALLSNLPVRVQMRLACAHVHSCMA